MNINGISNDSGSAVSALLALKNNTQTAASTDANSASASSAASSSTVSKPGELMAKLSQLLQQDPAKFKQVTQQISDELKSQAADASGPQAQFLSKLSDNFAQAASSGSLASLAPPSGGEHAGAAAAHHHHGGHHGGVSGGIESVLSKALDEVNQALSTNSA
ncbi:MAG: hypothetical protein ABW061_07720 [Polyangiaceae bacterium]